MNFRFRGSEFGEDAAEAERVFAKGGAHQVVAGGCGVALVEDEVDDFEHGRETGGEFGAAGHLEGDVLVCQGTLGADDALGDGGFWNEEGAGDFFGGKAAEKAEGEGGAGFGGEDGMAGDENETEDVVVDSCIGDAVAEGGFKFAREHFVFALGDGVSAEQIDGAAFGGCGEPCRGVIGDARLRPLLECGDERLLSEVFCEADVTGEARESGDDSRGLDAPDGLDGTICGEIRFCNGHCYRSHQFLIPGWGRIDMGTEIYRLFFWVGSTLLRFVFGGKEVYYAGFFFGFDLGSPAGHFVYFSVPLGFGQALALHHVVVMADQAFLFYFLGEFYSGYYWGFWAGSDR